MPEPDAETEPTTPRPGEGITSRTARGVAWKGVSTAYLQVLTLVSTVVVARLLSPDQFGLASEVMVFTTIATDLGLGATVIQRTKLDEVDRSTVFWSSLMFGGVLTVAGMLAAVPMAHFYREPQVAPLVAVVSLSFIVVAVGSTHYALIIREMNFRGLELLSIGARTCGAIVAITLAAAGAGAWAIVGSFLAMEGVATVLLWRIVRWRPHRVFSIERLRGFAGYSLRIYGTHILWQVGGNVDTLVIGRRLGTSKLALYAMAQTIVQFPLRAIGAPVQDVLFPAFAQIQSERERVARGWLLSSRFVAAVTLPALVGVAVLASQLISVLLGAKWAGAVPVVQISAFAAFLSTLQRLNHSVLQARGRADVLLRFATVQVLAGAAAVIIGSNWGIVGVAVAYLTVGCVIQPLYFRATASTLDVSMVEVLANLRGIAEAALVMLGCMLLAKAFVVGGASDLVQLITLSFIGTASYLAVLRFTERELISYAWALRHGSPSPQGSGS